ncbi:MAG: hypothetical protein ACYTGH_09570 [Planctomycetota bacterium]|jgi:hypothetical protein
MKRDFTDAEAARLDNAIEACLAIARHYRKDIADEDSIVLLQDLLDVDKILDTGHGRDEDHHLINLPK